MGIATNPKTWLPDQRLGGATVGILAFEVAAAMTRLVSLHRTLSEDHILRLRSETMRSQGVAYLNSTDQSLLLRLAFAEIMDDLDRTASAIDRLRLRCRGGASPSDRVYADLKAGSADPRMDVLKGAEKTARKMERHVASTARLYEEMEILAELDAAERKLYQQWGRHSGPIPLQLPAGPALTPDRLELRSQRHKVRRLKEESLWGLSFDKAVALMARAACAVFARVCAVFGPFVSGLPPVHPSVGGHIRHRFKFRIHPRLHSSGPIHRSPPAARDVAISNSSPIIGSAKPTDPVKILEQPESSVGGSGLAVRYANIIEIAERILMMREAEEATGREEAAAREELYELLPVGMRKAVRGKMADWWRLDSGPMDGSLAEGWKEAVKRIMNWLGPMARDTVQWQAERNMDRRYRFDPRPRVTMLQTLHFSDREKTEAAITEVLVGLSLVGWYEERRRPSIRI